ncbi:hypothetical protein BCR39DRAFT_345065 [Naematelia encephala]|uniref:N-acetyltransferase domain-containing protein n=1 Tax=Naematelia encephala TaxID=71784 RepID=A0A1Y2AMI1_9TREE|nr:hypothetical protein BCR39DRAFT_345065 [Naematelia encephala]
MDLPSLEETTVVPATPQEALLADKYRSDTEWFFEFAKWYNQQPFSQDGRWIAWTLVKRADVNKPDRQCLSFLCTQRRDALIKSSSGSITTANFYNITVVMTPEVYRGRGYATRLLRTIHYLLAPPANIPPWPASWGARPELPTHILKYLPPGVGSQLIPIISPRFFERCLIGPDDGGRRGWEFFKGGINSWIRWKVHDLGVADADSTKWETEWIQIKDLEKVGKQVSQELHRTWPEAPPPSPGTTIVRTDPASPGLLRHIEFAIRYANRPGYDDSQIIGVQFHSHPEIQGSKSVTPTAIFWPHLPEPGIVSLTFTSNLDVSLLPLLINRIRAIAPQCTELEVWGLEQEDPVARMLVNSGAIFGDRIQENHRPLGLAWYGPEGTKGIWEDMTMWVRG